MIYKRQFKHLGNTIGQLLHSSAQYYTERESKRVQCKRIADRPRHRAPRYVADSRWGDRASSPDEAYTPAGGHWWRRAQQKWRHRSARRRHQTTASVKVEKKIAEMHHRASLPPPSDATRSTSNLPNPSHSSPAFVHILRFYLNFQFFFR